jgi:N-acetylglucosamine kinase-like BadF-type ATPase
MPSHSRLGRGGNRMDIALFAGIDAGGTSTRCLVADRYGHIIGLGRGGPGNCLLSGPEIALHSIRAAVAGALAGAPEPGLAFLHIAAAGTVTPRGVEALAGTVSTGNDAPAALIGALIEEPGAIVIAGTGSACCGQDGNGRMLIEGGWGPLAGDEGSGYAIGREAVRVLARVMDGREPDVPLTIALRDRLGAVNRAAFQAALYDPPLPREEVAALSSLVAEAAAQGDDRAIALLAQAGRDLAHVVRDMLAHLDLLERDTGVVTRGGVWQAGEPILGPFTRALRRNAPRARVTQARFPAVAGAVLLAYRQAGMGLESPLLDTLEGDLAGRRIV